MATGRAAGLGRWPWHWTQYLIACLLPGPVQDAKNLLMGAPSGELQGPLSPLAQQEALSAPQELVEVGTSLVLSGFEGVGVGASSFLPLTPLPRR